MKERNNAVQKLLNDCTKLDKNIQECIVEYFCGGIHYWFGKDSDEMFWKGECTHGRIDKNKMFGSIRVWFTSLGGKYYHGGKYGGSQQADQHRMNTEFAHDIYGKGNSIFISLYDDETHLRAASYEEEYTKITSIPDDDYEDHDFSFESKFDCFILIHIESNCPWDGPNYVQIFNDAMVQEEIQQAKLMYLE